MSTDLHEALREAVADPPFDASDVHSVVDAGSRRVRRRAVVRIGSSALVVVAAVLTSVGIRADRSDQEPRPADVVHLDLSQAERQDLDVVATARTTMREPMDDPDGDRLVGLTTDGLVLRNRISHDGGVRRLGLLDPSTGSTDWLPSPPVGVGGTPVELTAEHLVLFERETAYRGALSVFDRRSETWQSSTVRLPYVLELHVPLRLALGPDGRLYLGGTPENQSGPLSWLSYAVPEGGEARPEPALTGAAVAWAAGVQARADNDGRVVLSTPSAERLVAEERPASCETPTDPDLADLPVLVGLAGDRPVVTYWCGEEAGTSTLVYDVDRGDVVQVDGAALLAADGDHVLLRAAARGPADGFYLLDLEHRALTRFGGATQPAEYEFALVDGLVLWNQAGPIEDRDVYDVVWNVARLPVGDRQ